MANTALQKLMFTIALIDKVSGPAARVQKRIAAMTETAKGGFETMVYGGAGVLGAAKALDALVGPARDVNRALGEVRSLGVANNILAELERTALSFTSSYGGSAAEFIRSSYDIQSAIASLRGTELPAFAEAGAILAKATKSDVATITNYMGTMYGVFRDTAEQMGKSQWVQQMAGQTALAVQMFKTTGPQMAGAFGALGAAATSAGVKAAEQIAILGQLQSTMSGSEAAARYRAFLAGVGKAQAELGMQFTDSSGRMLGMVDILGKLRARFGDTFELAETDKLMKAFGSNEAVALIQLLMQDTAGLSDNIAKLGDVRGMQVARDMAADMVDPLERMLAGFQANRIALGKALLPVLDPLINKMADASATITRWTTLFPNLTRWVGVGVFAVFGLVGAVSAFALITGIAKIAWVGFAGIIAAGKAVMLALQAVMVAVRTAVLLFNLSLYANPMMWVIALIVGAIAAIAALIYYWDDITETVRRFGASILESAIKPLRSLIGWINRIPGISIDTSALDRLQGIAAPINTVAAPELATPLAPALETRPRLNVPQGGLVQQFANLKGGNVYHVQLQSEQAMGPRYLDDWLGMNAP